MNSRDGFNLGKASRRAHRIEDDLSYLWNSNRAPLQQFFCEGFHGRPEVIKLVSGPYEYQLHPDIALLVRATDLHRHLTGVVIVSCVGVVSGTPSRVFCLRNLPRQADLSHLLEPGARADIVVFLCVRPCPLGPFPEHETADSPSFLIRSDGHKSKMNTQQERRGGMTTFMESGVAQSLWVASHSSIIA